MRTIQFIAIIPFLAAACGPKENDERTPVTHEIAVTTAPVVKKAVNLPVFTAGLLASETEALLSFKIGGIIQRINVEEGQKIRKGQLLATLDLTEINALVIQAKNGVEKAERDLQRVKNLYKDDAATLENMQDLTTTYNVAKEALRIARFNQKFAEIRATTNGTVVRKIMNEGELVNPGTPVLFINDTSKDQWKLEVGVPDKDWAKLKLGDKANVFFDAYPGETFEGEVFRLAEGADPANGSYKIEVKVHPGARKFASGLFAEAKIFPKGDKTYHVVPVEAIVDGFGKNAFVFIPEEKTRVKKIPIHIAFMFGNEVAVNQGLENVQQVITGGSGFLTEVSTIKIMNGSFTSHNEANPQSFTRISTTVK